MKIYNHLHISVSIISFLHIFVFGSYGQIPYSDKTSLSEIIGHGEHEVASVMAVMEDTGAFYRSNLLPPLHSFQPYKTSPFYHHIQQGQKTINHLWFALPIKNLTNDSLNLIFYPGFLEKVYFFEKKGQDWINSQNGKSFSKSLRAFPLPCVYPLSLGPLDSSLLLILLKDQVVFSDNVTLKLYKKSDFLLSPPAELQINEAHALFTAFLLGALAFIIAFSILQYIQVREEAYLFYILYLSIVFLYFLINGTWEYEWYRAGWIEETLYYFMEREKQFEIPLAALTYSSYILFANSFLNLKDLDNRLYKILVYFIYFFLVYIFIDKFLYSYFGPDIAEYGIYAVKGIGVILGLFFIVWTINKGSLLAYYILGGSAILLILGGINNFLTTIGKSFNFHLSGFWGYPLFYSQLGILGEVFFFSAGLGYKTRKELEQKNQERMEAIYKELGSKLNTHFIFNAINSIKNLLYKEEKELSIAYLTKFAKLFKMVLVNSKSSLISLEKEIDICQLYLDLEKLRFKEIFEGNIHIDKEVNIQETMVPPLIFQPYIENAIQHGLFEKKGLKKLDIHVKSYGNYIVCSVDDNGIGRQKIKERKEEIKFGKESQGMNISLQRLSYHQIRIEIIDKKDDQGHPSGTTVDMYIPNN